VFVNGRLAVSASAMPREGEIVSVRGYGRFEYRGAVGLSRKGRLFVAVGVYGKK